MQIVFHQRNQHVLLFQLLKNRDSTDTTFHFCGIGFSDSGSNQTIFPSPTVKCCSMSVSKVVW